MNGDQDRGLPPEFYKGLSYLGRPVTVGLTGESPVGTPASGASAIPSAGVGATAPAKGAAGATGPAGGPSSIQQALQALGLTQKGVSAAKLVSGTPEQPGAAAAPEVPRGLSPDAGPSLPSEIGHEVIPPPQPVPVGQPVAETIEGIGTETAPAQGAATAGEAGSAATLAEGATPTPALLIPLVLAALEAAGVQMPTPITAAKQFGPVGEFSSGASFAFNPSAKTGINLAESLSTYGLSDVFKSFFGSKPPATPFPSQTWTAISSKVASALPQKIPMPTSATPEQQKAIQDANAMIDTLQGYAGAEPPWLTGATPQSAESWNNITNKITSDVQGYFTQLGTLYPAAAKAAMDAQTASRQQTAVTSPSSGFFRGTEKLPQQGS